MPTLSDNAALNILVGLVTSIEESAREGYTSIAGDNNLTASLADPYTSPANPACVLTVITNTGAVALNIYEDGFLIKIGLTQGQTWVSPNAGSGAIEVVTLGAGTTFALARYIL